VEFTIDELTALVLEHGRRAMQSRKTAEALLKLAAEDDRLAQVYLEAGKRVRREADEQESRMTMRKIISGVSVLVLMLCVLSVSSFTLAQDVPLATVEATVNGQPVEATLEPVTTPAPVPQPADNTALILETLKELALIIALIVLAFKVAGLVTADVMDKALARGFDLAKELADTTPTPIDNSILEIAQPIISKLIADELAKQRTVTITPNTLQNVTVPTIGGTSTFTDVG
jgi:hypothetical protein